CLPCMRQWLDGARAPDKRPAACAGKHRADGQEQRHFRFDPDPDRIGLPSSQPPVQRNAEVVADIPRYANRLTLRLPSGDEKAWLPSFEKMRPDRRSGLALGDSDIMRVQDETAHGEIEGTIQLFGPAAITWARASAKRAQRRGQRGVVGIDRLA